MRDILMEIANEIIRPKRPPDYNSIHEGLGMIRDKYINLENDIFDIEHEHLTMFRDMCEEVDLPTFDGDNRNEPASMRDNALQLAVMAIRMVRFIDKQPRNHTNRLMRFQQYEDHGDNS